MLDKEQAECLQNNVLFLWSFYSLSSSVTAADWCDGGWSSVGKVNEVENFDLLQH